MRICLRFWAYQPSLGILCGAAVFPSAARGSHRGYHGPANRGDWRFRQKVLTSFLLGPYGERNQSERVDPVTGHCIISQTGKRSLRVTANH